MDAATLLRTARSGAQVTQTVLGRRAGVPQARISEIERGRADPSVGRLLELIRASRHTLALLPTLSPPAHEAADEIGEYLRQGDEGRAFRRFVQLSDDLVREPLHVLIALASSPPRPVGHAGFDAALAALIEYRTEEAEAGVPTWVYDEWRVCEQGWSPSEDPVLAAYSRATAPEPFRRRGVYISADDLVSV